MGRPVLRMHRRDRVLAWLVTGPIGHLLAGIADLGLALLRIAWARLRGRAIR